NDVQGGNRNTVEHEVLAGNSAGSTQESDAPTTEGQSQNKKRGITKGYEVMKRVQDGTKIGGIFLPENGQSFVGPNVNLLKTEIGVITRLMAPLRKYYWSELTEAEKQPLFAKLETEFDINSNDVAIKKILSSRMQKRFLNYKHHCNKHYNKDPLTARS
ncbi:unnamed protein product, partial [Linum tenue]